MGRLEVPKPTISGTNIPIQYESLLRSSFYNISGVAGKWSDNMNAVHFSNLTGFPVLILDHSKINNYTLYARRTRYERSSSAVSNTSIAPSPDFDPKCIIQALCHDTAFNCAAKITSTIKDAVIKETVETIAKGIVKFSVQGGQSMLNACWKYLNVYFQSQVCDYSQVCQSCDDTQRSNIAGGLVGTSVDQTNNGDGPLTENSVLRSTDKRQTAYVQSYFTTQAATTSECSDGHDEL